MKITTIGLDIAKSVFHLFAVNQTGRLIKKKQLKRKQVLGYMGKLEPCLIAMEACGGAHYWAREFVALGRWCIHSLCSRFFSINMFWGA